MLARCARVEPAMAFMPSAFELAWTSRCLSCWTTLMPALRANVNDPLAPLTVTASAPMVTLTPCGRSIGFFATRDIVNPLDERLSTAETLLNDEQDFAARTRCPSLLIGHDAL